MIFWGCQDSLAGVEDFDDSLIIEILLQGSRDFDDIRGCADSMIWRDVRRRHRNHPTRAFRPTPPGNAGRWVKNDGGHVDRSIGAQRFHLDALRKVGPSELHAPDSHVARSMPHRAISSNRRTRGYHRNPATPVREFRWFPGPLAGVGEFDDILGVPGFSSRGRGI